MLIKAPWTPMRGITFATSLLSTAVVVTIPVASAGYTGSIRFGVIFWLVVAIWIVSTTAYTGACVRDQMSARHDDLGQALKLLAARLENIELTILDYGDRREARGHQLATGVTNMQRNGRLHSVDG